jgi:hypothetical protein
MLFAGASLCAPIRISAAPQAVFTREELKTYFALQQRLYPKNGDQFRKLVQTFGDRKTFTIDQVTATTDPKTKKPKEYPDSDSHPGPEMVDSVPYDVAERQLREYEKTHPEFKKKLSYTYPADEAHKQQRLVEVRSLMEALEWKYGKQNWYLAMEVRDVEENGVTPKIISQVRLKDDPVQLALKAARRSGFKGLLIRQSWRDVLYEDEDRSMGQTKGATLKDLVGATVSFSRNNLTRMDTWSINGAVIFPWERNFPDEPGWSPVKIMLAPSITVDRVDTNGDPKNETDSMLYRIGAYGDWLFNDQLGGLEARAAAVFATNTGHTAFLPGAELDLEPRWHNGVLPIGYSKILVHKAPLLEDGSDQSLADIQFRCWLHLEGGDVHDAGKSWNAAKGSFFRAGPTAQLQVNFPRLFLGKSFSITGLYSYLPAVSGPEGHESFFSVTGAYDLMKDDVTGNKISINGQYQKGALNFTKDNIDTFTVGIGVRF